MTRSTLCIWLLLLLAAAPAAGVSDTERELRDLLEITGFQRSVEQIPEAAAQELERAARGGPEAAGLENTLRKAFDPAPVLGAVLEELGRAYDPAKAQAVRDWYQSAPGLRVRRLKESSLSEQGRPAYREFVAGLRRELPSPERRILVGRLDEATRAVEKATTVSVAVSHARALLLASVRVEEEAPVSSAPDRSEQELRARIEPVLREQMYMLLHFTTRELSIAELESYVAFTESEAFGWYRDTAFRGFERGIAGALESLR